MARERAEDIQDPFFETQLILPDGLSCRWIYADSTVDELVLRAKAYHIAKELSERQEVRICCDDPQKIASVGIFLKAQARKLNVNWGGNTYFEYDLKAAPLREQLSWQNYQDKYVFYGIEPQHHPEEIEILKTLMQGGFDLKNDRIFDKAVHNRQNNIYIIKHPSTGLFVGGFVLVYLPVIGEVQLHSVSGRSVHPFVSRQESKLPIIMSAVLQAIEDDYPQRIPYGIAKNSYLENVGPKRLTFSTSGEKRVLLYENLGFEESSRSGVAVKLPVDTHE